MKKIALLLCTIITASVVFSGCGSIGGPKATPNPEISNLAGQVLPGKEPGVQGTIKSLDDEKMKVLVDGEKYTFILGEKGKSELALFNKDPENPRIMKGSFVNVYYEEVDGDKMVNSIEIVESN